MDDRVSQNALLVLTTCANAEEANAVAAMLVERRLAACVSTVRAASTYRWQDRIEQEQEWLLMIKTTAPRYPAVEQAIRAASSYELPEVIAVPVTAGSAPYLAWVAAELEHADSP
jgi:periplasmic divalent cation tolerance protein